MLQNKKIFYNSAIIWCFIFGIFCSGKKEHQEATSGTITSITGSVHIYKVKGTQWEELTALTKIDFGDSIKTAVESQVEIKFTDEYSIKIQENSKIVIPTIHGPEQ